LRPRRGLLGDHGAMDVLSSRVLLHPTDPERSRVFYRDTLGLAIYREFGSGPERGSVFFLGGGFLELSGRAAAPPAPGMALWLQVRELAGVRRELGERGVQILREPKREPWGCWRCGSRTPMGCASASWRCRRSIRCAAAADTHLSLLYVLPQGLAPKAPAGWRWISASRSSRRGKGSRSG
jgi:predicted enzyme related to lactoylglutathione lyase